MSENKHTPEPWQVFEDDPRAIVTKENPMLSLLSVGEDGLAIMYEEADARRIVACVNACEGISTEYLEKFSATTFNDFKRMKEQRDELLTIVKGFHRKLETYRNVYSGDKELRRLLDECEAAIAKAKP